MEVKILAYIKGQKMKASGCLKKNIYKYVKNKIIILIFFILISVVVSLSSIALTFYNGLFIDIITKNPNQKSIIEYAAFIFVLTMISIVISYTYSIVDIKLKTDLSFLLTKDIICHIQKVSIIEYKRYNPVYLNQLERVKIIFIIV